MKRIESVDNFRVTQWVKLKDKMKRDNAKEFLAEGYHVVAEAYRSGYLKEVLTTENKEFHDVPTYCVREDVMKKITSLATPTKIVGICRQMEPRPYTGNVLLLDQIHHPGNLGTIIRSAVAFNIDTIILNESVDLYNQKVIQATQGMIFHLNILKAPLKSTMLDLKKDGYQVIGTDVRDGVSLDDFRAAGKHAVLIGNEGNGLGDDLLSLCDVKVNIKMNPLCESLNVGVAAGIILFCLK